MERFRNWIYRMSAYAVCWREVLKLWRIRRKLRALRRGKAWPLAGVRVRFDGAEWVISRAGHVHDPSNPDYRYRLNLVQYDEAGRVVNVATGIRNTDLEGVA